MIMNVSSIWCPGCYLQMTYLTCLPCSYSNEKTWNCRWMNFIFSFLSLSFFSPSLSPEYEWLEIFLSFSFTWWFHLNEFLFLLLLLIYWKNSRVIIFFCFYSISRRWLSMLWACHFFHKRENIDRYRKYDTASLSLSYSFFLWSCVILNWINI